MHILEALYRGKINSGMRTFRRGSEYERLSDQRMAENDHVYRELSLEGQAHYKAAERITGMMESIETEDAFIEGFRLGVKLLLAAIAEYDGQFETEDSPH